MSIHLGLSAWLSPVSLTLGRFVKQVLAFLEWVLLLVSDTFYIKLSCSSTELQLNRAMQWSEDVWQVGPLPDLKLKRRPKSSVFQLLWNTTEDKNKQTNKQTRLPVF